MDNVAFLQLAIQMFNDIVFLVTTFVELSNIEIFMDRNCQQKLGKHAIINVLNALTYPILE